MLLTPTRTRPEKNHKVPVLISYAFLKDMTDDKVRSCLSNPHVEILLDSGAFTALNAGIEICLEEYMGFLHKWKDYLFGYMALDKLGDPKQTDIQLQIMLSEGLKPIPVHVRGDDGKRMDQLFEWSDWVACGGLRRPHSGPAPKEYTQQKMIWAKGRNVLGWVTLPSRCS